MAEDFNEHYEFIFPVSSYFFENIENIEDGKISFSRSDVTGAINAIHYHVEVTIVPVHHKKRSG